MSYLCIYCKKGTTEVLPSLCGVCGKYLSAEVKPSMKLTTLVDLGLKNGVRFDFKLEPIKKSKKGKKCKS